MALGDPAGMQIGDDQGQLLTMLTRLIGARRAIEVGTFTGYSGMCIARGLPDDGKLLCCDVSVEWTSIAQDGWNRRRSGRPDRAAHCTRARHPARTAARSRHRPCLHRCRQTWIPGLLERARATD